ncbi:MAG: ABC transporter ATP-binding protein, partial [Roseobacter sp.]|nr:ABC transporter ATP-binding protein [Roseobacter sp.]
MANIQSQTVTSSEDHATVVQAEGLNLTFQTGDGPVHALSDVNLTIGKGDFVS